LWWKGAWIRKLEGDESRGAARSGDVESLRRELRTTKAPGKYFCQSTELERVTRPLSTLGRLRIAALDLCLGNAGIIEMIRMIASPLFWKTVHTFLPVFVEGKLEKTPTESLGLEPGEMVEVKSAEEIADTLTALGRNRGLRYDHNLNQHCGKKYRVRDRLDRMILESTGEMIFLQNTVTLQEVRCQCEVSAVGGCPRRDWAYWREIWLRRVAGSDSLVPSADLGSRPGESDQGSRGGDEVNG
jgi:hypothetical protein